MSTNMQQWKNNQVSYKAKGWPLYPQDAYNTHRDDTTSPPITDWVPGEEPAWTPIARGKGWGVPKSGNRGTAPGSKANNAGVGAPIVPPITSTQQLVEQLAQQSELTFIPV